MERLRNVPKEGVNSIGALESPIMVEERED